MKVGKLYFFDMPDPDRPVECKYITDIGYRKYFEKREDAILFLFDNGVRTYQFLTKNDDDYKKNAKILTYELWQIENRVGYVIYDYEPYVNENNEVKKRRSYVWRFVGFGRSCFAQTEEELIQKVTAEIEEYQEDREKRGYNTYPYYTKHNRNKKGL